MLIIIGGGPTGLSAGIRLKGKKKYLILEKNALCGGISTSINKNGFIFDYSGHLLHLRWKETKDFILSLTEYNLIRRNSNIYIKNRYIDYPFQINMYNLPQKIKSECVSDFIKSQIKQKKETNNFKLWAKQTFGNGICKYFMYPYNEKLFAYPIEKLTTNWLGNFVPVPDINQVLKGAYQKSLKGIGYNQIFYYPKYNGIKSLIDGLVKLNENISTNSQVTRISFKNKKVYLTNLKEYRYTNLINTMPLKDFIRISDAPDKIKDYANKLKHNTIYVYNLGIKRTNRKEHWIYFPETQFPFYRLGFYNNFSKNNTPYGYDSLYIEFSVKENDFIDINKMKSKTIKKLIELGLIKNENDIITELWLKIDCGYIIYDDEREKYLKPIFEYLKTQNVISTGRYGAWKYSFIEENIKDGFNAADLLLNSWV